MTAAKWAGTTTVPGIAKEGQLVIPGGKKPKSRIAEGAIRAGLLVARGTSEQQVKPLAAVPTADPDAIITALATAVAEQDLAGTDLDGAIGAGKIDPPRPVSITFSNHANYDATTGYLYGYGPSGQFQFETFAIPDGGNATVYSRLCYSQVTRVIIAAQAGTGGSTTVGLAAARGPMALPPEDYGVAIYDPMLEPSDTSTVTFDDEEPLSVAYDGVVGVIVEDAVAIGDLVGVRVVLDGTDVRGQFTKMPSEAVATAEFALLIGARFITAADADGVALVELGG